MKFLALLVGLVSAAVLLVGNTALHVTAVLDLHPEIERQLLMIGDLRPLIRSDAFAAAFPHLGYGASLVALGPLALMIGVGIGLLVLRLRCRGVPAAVLAMAALFAGALPYGVGAFALRGNTVPEDTGPWVAWMLLGPMYCAALALLFTAAALLAPGRRGAKRSAGAKKPSVAHA